MTHIKGTYENEDFFDELLNKYGELIKRLIFTYVKNYSVTDDIAQEVFISIYKNIDQFKGESNIKTWIFRIAINKCKDYLKSPKYQYQKFLGNFNEIGNQISGEKNTVEILIKRENGSELIKHVMELPVKYREVIIYYYYFDFTIEEMSKLLSINSNTIKTRLSRAKKNLKERLLETGGDFDEY